MIDRGRDIELKRRARCNPINESRRKKQPQVSKRIWMSVNHRHQQQCDTGVQNKLFYEGV